MSGHWNRETLVVIKYGLPGNHNAKISEAIQRNPLILGADLIVAHDDWCDLLAGTGPCNCDPEVKTRAMKQ